MSDIDSDSGDTRWRRRSQTRHQFLLTGNPNLLGLPYFTHVDDLTGGEEDNESLLDSAQYLGHYDSSDTGPAVPCGKSLKSVVIDSGKTDTTPASHTDTFPQLTSRICSHESKSGVELVRRPPPRYGTWKPVEDGITLTWRDLSVYVPQKKTWYKSSSSHKPYKLVLNSVSGAVRPGSLVALMGASGAGKSTLMNALAHRTPGEVVVDGDILVNGHRANRSMNSLSGYVHQDDLFVASLTVLEHLTFMARLRMDVRTSSGERRSRVQELVKELGLNKVKHSRIGCPGSEKSLSGGERKRLAFASEILTDPPLLFCDEPTTGLDSFNARKLVRMMKDMAARGKTILCTIHQPSTEVFLMFDKLLLLAEGRLAYMGSSNGALEFLDGLGHKCPSTFNPADFYIHTLAVQPGHELRSRERIKRICDNFAVSAYAKDVELIIQYQDNRFLQFEDMQKSYDGTYSTDSTSNTASSEESIVHIIKHIPKLPGWWTQLYWLWWRAVKDSYRNPAVHGIRILQKIVMALLIGLCYFGVEINQRGIQDIEGVLFIYITENTFPSVYAVLNVFPLELPLFLREYKNGIYRCDTYYISKMAALMPGFFLDPLIFVCICYWIVGLRPHLYQFLMTTVVLIFTTNTASSCGAMFSAMFESLPYAMVMLVPFLMMLLITGGLMVNLGSLPPYIGWIKYFSWFMYSNEALTVVQWEGVNNITCETGPRVPCLTEGRSVMQKFTFNYQHIPMDLVCMTVLFISFHTIGFLGLMSRARRK